MNKDALKYYIALMEIIILVYYYLLMYVTNQLSLCDIKHKIEILGIH